MANSQKRQIPVKFCKSILFLFFLFFHYLSNAQFIVSNSAENLGLGYYKLTNAANNEIGYMWHITMHNMNNPLVVEGRFNFGSDTGGADGICFIIQDQCAGASGVAAGGGVGYFQIPGRSIAIEFDTYQNITGTGDQDNHDPLYDHIAIEKMGNVDHGVAAHSLLLPTPISSSQNNVKDGLWHDFGITYTPATNLIEVFFDGDLRVSYTYDILNNIFNGNPNVYWGFSASTGGQNNLQQVFINKTRTTSVLKDTTVCNESITLNLPTLSQFAGKNQALNKTVRVSSLEGPAPLNLAVDGNMSSRWSSQFSDPQWIRIDLGGTYDIDSVVLFWEGAYGRQYRIQYTADTNSVWMDAFTETNGDGGKDLIVAAGTNIRYVRMYGMQRATGYGYSIWEFQVYGNPKYVWSPDNGSISDIYSPNPVFTTSITTTYKVSIPDACIVGLTDSFTIIHNCSLPVTFIDFTAVRTNGVTQLNWITTNEVNASHFIVERSFDAVNFEYVWEVKAHDTFGQHTYFFKDPFPLEGVLYYRIVEVDKDNALFYSPIRAVSDSSFEFSIVPNPNNGLFTLVGFSKELKQINYLIVDAVGQVLSSGDLAVKNYFNIPFNLEAYAPGVYLVKVFSDSAYQIKKVIKK